jgi:hypothetical protein
VSGRCSGVRRYWWRRETGWVAVFTRGGGGVHGGERVTCAGVVLFKSLLSSTKGRY